MLLMLSFMLGISHSAFTGAVLYAEHECWQRHESQGVLGYVMTEPENTKKTWWVCKNEPDVEKI